MNIRKISYKDFHNNYFNLLNQLTDIEKEKITFDKFKHFIDNLDDNHQIMVIELNNKIIGSGTLLVENKIIHGLGKVGHIEDIVVDTTQRGLGLGRKIIDHLTKLAESLNCYKVILNCNESNVKFYEKCGYKKKEFEMVKYF